MRGRTKAQLIRLLTVVTVTGLLAGTGVGALAAGAPPSATTLAPSAGATTAIFSGSLNPNGTDTSYYFQYGTSTAFGTTTPVQSAGSGTGTLTATTGVNGLTPSTTYYVQLVATNSNGTTLGGVQQFATTATSANVVTQPPTAVTATSAVFNGSVNPNGAATTYYFQYGTTPSFGSTTVTQNAGSSSAPVPVSVPVTGLAPGRTYYYQLVATNSVWGTSAGGTASFATAAATTVTAATTTAVSVFRVSGTDRYQTSAGIAESKYPSGVPSGNVVLVTGRDFPDALAGNYLAGQLGAPILLSPPNVSDPSWNTTASALSALRANHVYILGGTTAVGSDVEATLAQSMTVTRIGGAGRYDTMQMIDTAAGLTPGTGVSGNRTAIVANGQNFPDALAGGPLSWAYKLPIVLTDGTQPTLSSQALAVISADGISHFVVLGGSLAINPAQISQLAGLGTIDQQFAGADRTDTAAQLAGYLQSSYGFSTTTVILAAGHTFPDALSAGPWGGDRQPIYLTEDAHSLGSYTTSALQGLAGSLTTIDIPGGPDAVDASTAQAAQVAGQSSSNRLPPTVATGSAGSVSSSSATMSGTVTPNGSATTYYFQYGTSTGLGQTTPVNTTPATGSYTVTSTLNALTPNTTYYYRLVASNTYGTSYGSVQSFFTANPFVPSVATASATGVGASTATLNGTVNPNGSPTTYYFQYGTSTAFGSATTAASVGSGTATVAVAANVGGLAPGTTYFFQLVATNSYGTATGGVVSFTTTSTTQPVVTSLSPTGGSTGGGNTVVVNGANFTAGSAVRFGATSAGVSAVNAGGTQITVVAPAHAAGLVDVTVTTANGTSATSAADRYTYVSPPQLTAATITPGRYTSGTTSGTTGTVLATFNEPVTCAQASDYVYVNGLGGTPVPFATCTPVGAAPSTQWVLAPTAGTTLATPVPTVASLTYTQAAPTTANATYAAAGNNAVYEPTGDRVTG